MEADSMEQLLVAMFCDINDFCKAFEEYWRKYLITDGSPIIPRCAMNLSEIMTIIVFFRLSGHRTFKWYYKNYICGSMKEYFPHRLSCDCFVEVIKDTLVPLTVYLIIRAP